MFLSVLCYSYLRAAKIDEEILVKANAAKIGKTDNLTFLEVSVLNKNTGAIFATRSYTKVCLSTVN